MPRQPQHKNPKSKSTRSEKDLIGSRVAVIQKQHQSTGEQTIGVVQEVLTNKAYHPRGLKVRLEDGTVGRIVVEQGSNPTNTSAPRVPDGRSLADFMTASFSPPSAEQQVHEEWVCSICTFVNSGLLPECEMCQSKRSCY